MMKWEIWGLVRDSEEDSVIDLTIALEALFSDEGNQEMTHKLALRVGAISRGFKDFNKSPQQVFEDIKSIYKYRSAIVHGNSRSEKKRVKKIDSKKETTDLSIGIEYLRFSLKALIGNPKYRNPKTIDSELLLGNKSFA